MKRTLLAAGLCLAVCGCSGLDIKSLNRDADYFGDTSNVDGYIVYEPMTVVEITKEASCEEKDEDGKCKKKGDERCKVGAPIYLPNYGRPYRVKSKTGFGKAGVDVAISNGWQLGQIKDESDNTAVLNFVEKVLGVSSARGASPEVVMDKKTCPAEGLYMLKLQTDGRMELTPIKDYTTPST